MRLPVYRPSVCAELPQAFEPFDGHWYAVAPSRAIRRGKKPFRLKVFGVVLAVWRTDDGELQAIDDRCPHVGASLSGGRVENDRIVCPYHGARFDRAGHCVELAGVPSHPGIPAGLKNRIYDVAEADGWVFLHWAEEGAEAPPLQRVGAMTQDGPPKSTSVSLRTWKAHFSRAVENSFDAYHFWEVHRILPFGRNPEAASSVEQDELLLQIITTLEGREIEGSPALLYPNLWVQRLPGFATVSIAFVPVGERETAIWVRSDLHATGVPLLRGALSWMANKMWGFALWQDHAVVEEQTPLRSEDAHSHDVLIGYDRPMAAYRKMRRATVSRVKGLKEAAREQLTLPALDPATES